MKYKAIGFDYGGVLTGVPASIQSQNIARIIGATTTQYRSAFFKYNKKLNLGQITWRELWSEVLDDLGKSEKLDPLMDFFSQSDFGKLNPQILELISRLRALGFKIGLLSNNTPLMAEKIRQDLDGYFDIVEISAEVGHVKPDPMAFEHFEKSLGVKLGQLVFIDDSVMSLSTAAKVGYQPILYKDYDDLTQHLTQLGILP